MRIGQAQLEYLLLVGSAVVVGAIVAALVASSAEGLKTNILDVFLGKPPLEEDRGSEGGEEPLDKTKLTPSCSDNLDNDGDGYCDYSSKKAFCVDGSQVGDTECKNKNDDTEEGICLASPEICDAIDNDCDGSIDEGLSDTRPCGLDTGECFKGTQERKCYFGEWGEWSSCKGGNVPRREKCDGLDNDCDGQIDESCWKERR